jgi:hypothetical protein
MRVWGAQVDEVLFSVDTLRSPGRRGAEWDEGRPKLEAVIADMRGRHPNVRAVDVDYSDAEAALVSEEFFGGAPIPSKDCFGAPFYAYLHGLHAASNLLVLHLDADMLFGGRSESWLREATATLRTRSDVFVCAPLAGPPTSDGRMAPSIAARHANTQRYGSMPRPERPAMHSYSFRHMSTRVFLIDRQRFALRVGALKPMRLLRRTYPRRLGHPPFYPLETLLSRTMGQHSLLRLNMLGGAPGMWYLHPPQRDAGLADALPSLIERVEKGDIPAEQLGDDQMNDSMFLPAQARATPGPPPTSLVRVRRKIRGVWQSRGRTRDT